MAHRERCAGTGKVKFSSYGEAARRLLEISMAPGEGYYRPVQVTPRCPSCDAYHLSSKSAKPWHTGKQTRARRSRRKGGLTNR
jgi:hypothetical protein